MDTEDLVARLKAFAQTQPDVVCVYLFGSRARGDATSASDADVALLLRLAAAQAENADRYWAAALMTALDTDALDVLILNHLPTAFQFGITAEGRLLHTNDEAARVAWEVAMLGRYYDLRPFQQWYDQVTRTQLKETFTHAQRREYHRTLAALAGQD